MIFTVRKRSCGKVMFLHLSVSHSVHGGVSTSVHAGIHTPQADTPLLGRHPPSPSRRPLQRMVRILLECFLVIISVSRSLSPSLYFSSGFNSRQECTPGQRPPGQKLPGQRLPQTDTPRTETPPPPDRCKNITLPQLRCGR